MEDYDVIYRGKPQGRMTLEEIRERREQGQLPDGAEYWNEEQGDWCLVDELFPQEEEVDDDDAYWRLPEQSEEEVLAEEPPTTVPSVKRPILITVLCLLGFLNSGIVTAIALASLIQPPPKFPGQMYIDPSLALLLGVFGLITWIGIWRMRRWGFYLFVVSLFIGLMVVVSLRVWDPFNLGVTLVMLLILLGYRDRMK